MQNLGHVALLPLLLSMCGFNITLMMMHFQGIEYVTFLQKCFPLSGASQKWTNASGLLPDQAVGVITDNLLPYCSAWNAVLPHHIPRGSDLTADTRHAGKTCAAWHTQEGSFKMSQTHQTVATPPITVSGETHCTNSHILDHKLHPASFTFHRKTQFFLFWLQFLQLRLLEVPCPSLSCLCPHSESC